MQVQVSHEEFVQLAHQLYPDQSARVLAELRASKLEDRVRELQEAAEAAQGVQGPAPTVDSPEPGAADA